MSGTHDILEEARHSHNETYFFGLDTAPGSLTGNKDLDYTVLSIWRKLSNNVKEKVKCYSWQGNVVDQIAEIKQIITEIQEKRLQEAIEMSKDYHELVADMDKTLDAVIKATKPKNGNGS